MEHPQAPRPPEKDRFKVIFENMPAGVALLDREFRILDMNRKMREWFPGSLPEAHPRCYASFNDPARTEACPGCPAAKVFEDGKAHQSITSTPRPEGTRYYRITVSPILDDQGVVTSVIELMEDLTDQIRAEAALESEKSFAESLIRTVPTIILVLELDGRIRSYNPFFEKVAGRPFEEVSGRDFFEEFIPPAERDRARSQLLESREGASAPAIVLPLLPGKQDAVSRTVEWYDAVIHDETGLPAALVFSGQDVTWREAEEKQRRLLEVQLVHSQKLETIGTLAGGIAHDFNNILQPILGYVEMALEDSEGMESVQTNLKEVLRAAERARDLVKQILTFSRQASTEKAPLSLHLVVKEAARLLRSTIPSTIEVRQRIRTDCPPVMADATQLHQVVMNLCTNAYQAMESGPGVLEISLEECEVDEAFCARSLALKPGPYVRLTVEDSGNGMDAATLERIFEPFFTTKPFGKGTGLGLAMVHGIVAGHGGAVLVESSPGAGTTFEVYLPVCPSARRSRDEVASGPGVPARNLRALYVDDELAILAMSQRILEKRGISTIATSSPYEALEMFRHDPGGFDVVITDLMMPKMTGAGFAARIREIRPDIPVILVTGFSENLDPEHAASGPFVSVLHKPVGVSELLESILKAVEPPRS